MSGRVARSDYHFRWRLWLAAGVDNRLQRVTKDDRLGPTAALQARDSGAWDKSGSSGEELGRPRLRNSLLQSERERERPG